MKRRLAALILFLFATGAVAQEVDLGKVTPEELGGTDVRPIVAAAHQAYGEKRYEDAAKAFVKALRLSPGDSGNLYNLACCYGLLGMEGQAATFLVASWKAGFRDYGHISTDPDFDPVRKGETFAKAMAELAAEVEEEKRNAGVRIEVASPVLANVRVIEPAKTEQYRRYPLVVGLHGFGSNAKSFAALFGGRGIETDFLYCVPQAPYAFAPGAELGWSWSATGESVPGPTRRRSHEMSVRYVLDVVAAVKKRYPVDERNVYLMGFSQGAGMAFSIGMRHPELFRGVIPVGGWLDPGEHPRETVERAVKYGNFLICHSPTDRMVPFKSGVEAAKFMNEEDIRHEIYRYEGGHRMPKPLCEKIVQWIGEQSK